MAAATAATASASASRPYPCAATGGPNADAAAIGWLASAGTVSDPAGTVTIPASTHSVTVTLNRPP